MILRPATVGGEARSAQDPTVQIVIPAYNEAERLPRTLLLLGSWLQEARPAWSGVEVLVVDNASTDGTAGVASALSTPEVPVRVLHCAEPGKGAAVRAGILATTADLVAFVDADGATSFDAFTTALAHVAEGADVAVGSRAVPGSVTMVRHSSIRERGAAAYRWCTARLVPGIRDTQCGFKVFRGQLARRIFEDTRTAGFSFDVEVLGRARLLGATIAEFPVTWIDVPGSTFDPARHGVQSFAQLAGIGLMLRRSQRAPAPVTALPRRVLADPATAKLALDA